MTTFGWKRKAGERISKDTSLKFSAESEKDALSGDIRWVHSFKRKKIALQNTCEKKCQELKDEGIRLADLQRFKEAVSKWDEALSLAPKDACILEMKAQALLQLNDPFSAIQSAEQAVRFKPQWWVAYQTLGRSQLAIGDVKMAKASFCKAVHINPAEKELWEEDLNWAHKLILKQEELVNETDDEIKKSAETCEKMDTSEENQISENIGSEKKHDAM